MARLKTGYGLEKLRSRYEKILSRLEFFPQIQSTKDYGSKFGFEFQNVLLYFGTYFERLKAPSFALLISRYILRLGQAAQKQQRPRCPNPKTYLEIRRADERLFT